MPSPSPTEPSFTRRFLRALGHASIGAGIAASATAVILLSRHVDALPELESWHLTELEEDFTADSAVGSFEEYLELEERLFAELESKVVSAVSTSAAELTNRYSRGSLANPERWPVNWNRSYELPATNPAAGILLLHGMSDSPYSLRHLGQRLSKAGAHVVGLRLPGHGTIPSGLVTAHWRDMSAATQLAIAHVRSVVGEERPVYVVGYSNGGALAVLHALEALDDPGLARIDRIVLISPAIGVDPLAGLAKWQRRLSHWLGIDKLAWNSIHLEYDPFKYNSFAVNAGEQVYNITAEIGHQLTRRAAEGKLEALPPLMAFQSVVDATVSTRALLEGLFLKLPAGAHELVLFDLNRLEELQILIQGDPRETFEPLVRNVARSFTVTVVGNRSGDSAEVIAWRHTPQTAGGETRPPTTETLSRGWPDDLYSLSHVALPFPADDPLYGGEAPASEHGIQLGSAAPRGERGVLRVSADALLRVRWNPFYPYLERQLFDFLGLELPEAGPALSLENP